MKKINPKKFIYIKIRVNYDNHTLLNETVCVGINTRDTKKEKHSEKIINIINDIDRISVV